jgi:hypothetical protein
MESATGAALAAWASPASDSTSRSALCYVIATISAHASTYLEIGASGGGEYKARSDKPKSEAS